MNKVYRTLYSNLIKLTKKEVKKSIKENQVAFNEIKKKNEELKKLLNTRY